MRLDFRYEIDCLAFVLVYNLGKNLGRADIAVAEELGDVGIAEPMFRKRYSLFPATFLLCSGTFIGAIWANGWLKTDKSFNYFCIFAFLSVLFTYFGVNYILGGMHGYA